MNIFDLILVIKNHLSDEECQSLISEYERKRITAAKEQSYHVYEDKVTQSNFKRIEVIESSPNYELVRSKTEQALTKWLDYLQDKQLFSVAALRSVLRYPYNFRILKYEVGSYIHPHTDWDHFNYASVTLNLNDGYTGGEFSFMNGTHVLKLEKGDALIFPADHFWVHEVYPVITGNRYSVNTFISSIHKSDRNKMFNHIFDSHQTHSPVFKP
jgi:predicted 2-oxoglutarate/Fe(II)-dependent dioxygenase YbiX